MVKRGLLTVALAALVLPPAAGAGSRTTTLVPGVTYTKTFRMTDAGPLVTHVIRAPAPGGLYGLRPVLSNGTVLGRERVTSMQKRLTGHATTAGVNGGFFNVASGRPTGMFMRDGVMASRPLGERSSLGIAFDGSLRVARLGYRGTWQVEGFAEHKAEEFNRPLAEPPGVALFSGLYGGRTPRGRRAVDVILDGVPPLLSGGYAEGTVVRRRRGGETMVAPGRAVLQARGFWRDVILREAKAGRKVTVRVLAKRLWTDVADALGGGPALVQDGKAIWAAGEGFTREQLRPRHPRTAVGQLEDGRIILVVVDGRSASSIGLRNWELALEMQRLGAVTAMALDGGGSSTLAVDGRVLNVPSDGAERAVADGLLVFYYGAYAPPPKHRVVSPNGDGVLDTQSLAARITRKSSVKVRLKRPNGTVAWRFSGVVGHRVIRHDLLRTRRNGTWRWVAEAVDSRGRRSRMVRTFLVNNTLGHLVLSKSRMRVVSRRGGRVRIEVDLTRRSDVSVAVRRAGGALVRRLENGERTRGRLAFVWDGKDRTGSVVKTGAFRVVVRATNDLGTISLRKPLRVVRVKRS